MYFLVYTSPPKLLDVANSNFAGVKVTLCRVNWATFLMTLVKVKGQIKYFHVNASLPKL